MRSERGFSMLLVLLVVVVLSVIGVTTLTISTTELGVAGARAMQRQALAAADAGLNHFLGSSPASLVPNTYYVGASGTDPSHYVYLPPTKNQAGATVVGRYRVRTADPVPAHGGIYVFSEGEVLVDGQVAGRSVLSAIVTAIPGSGSNVAGQGQKAMSAWGTSSNMPTRTDISLIFD
jgi:type II secretory pathway pseudopilin PulG